MSYASPCISLSNSATSPNYNIYTTSAGLFNDLSIAATAINSFVQTSTGPFVINYQADQSIPINTTRLLYSWSSSSLPYNLSISLDSSFIPPTAALLVNPNYIGTMPINVGIAPVAQQTAAAIHTYIQALGLNYPGPGPFTPALFCWNNLIDATNGWYLGPSGHSSQAIQAYQTLTGVNDYTKIPLETNYGPGIAYSSWFTGYNTIGAPISRLDYIADTSVQIQYTGLAEDILTYPLTGTQYYISTVTQGALQDLGFRIFNGVGSIPYLTPYPNSALVPSSAPNVLLGTVDYVRTDYNRVYQYPATFTLAPAGNYLYMNFYNGSPVTISGVMYPAGNNSFTIPVQTEQPFSWTTTSSFNIVRLYSFNEVNLGGVDNIGVSMQTLAGLATFYPVYGRGYLNYQSTASFSILDSNGDTVYTLSPTPGSVPTSSVLTLTQYGGYTISMTSEVSLNRFITLPDSSVFLSKWYVNPPTQTALFLPTISGGQYDYFICWGDGAVEYNTTVHAYNFSPGSTARTYDVSIAGTCIGWNFGFSPTYNPNGTPNTYSPPTNAAFLSDVIRCGSSLTLVNQVGGEYFYSQGSLTWSATDPLQLGTAVDLTNIFYNCYNFNGAIGNWNVSSVNNLRRAFYGCSVFSQSLSSWNVSNVSNLAQTFANCNQFNHNLNNWNVSNVTTLNNTFSNCSTFNKPLLNWNTANVTDFTQTFNGCTAFNQDLSSWNTSSGTLMVGTFQNCTNFNSNLTYWNTANVTNMNNLFYGATNFFGDIALWNVDSVRWGAGYTATLGLSPAYFGQTTPPPVFNVGQTSQNGSFYQPWYASTTAHAKLMLAAVVPTSISGSYHIVPPATGLLETYSLNEPVYTFNVSGGNVLNYRAYTGLTYGLTGALNTANYSTGAGVLTGVIDYPVLTVGTNLLPQSPSTFSSDTTLRVLTNTGSIFLGFDNSFDQVNFQLTGQFIGATVVGINAMLLTVPVNTMVTITVSGPADFLSVRGDLMANSTLWYSPSDFVITLPFISNGTYDCFALWTNHTMAPQLLYINSGSPPPALTASAGYNTVTVFGQEIGWNTTRVSQSTANWYDMLACGPLTLLNDNNGGYFAICPNLVWTATDPLNLGDVSIFDSAFAGDIELSGASLGTWDTSGLTSLNTVFSGCINFNANLNSWDVSAVTSMNGLFQNCATYNRSLDSWHTGQVTSMASIFQNCTVFNGNLADWSVGQVTTLANAFNGCNAFNGNIGNWNTASNTDLTSTFQSCVNFNQNLNNWDVSAVTTLANTFNGCTEFNQPLNSWSVGSVTSLAGTFLNCVNFNQNLNSWNVSNVISFYSTFAGCLAYNQPLFAWNTISATAMNYMFSGCIGYNQNINSWNVGSVRTLSNTFANCTSFNQPLFNWHIGAVTTLQQTFLGCSAFAQDLSSWNPVNCTTLQSTFDGCSQYNSYMNDWDVGRVTTLYRTFAGCTVLDQSLDQWNTKNVVNMSQTFLDCAAFNTDLSSWDTGQVTTMYQLFNGAINFLGCLETWDTAQVANFNGFGLTDNYFQLAIPYFNNGPVTRHGRTYQPWQLTPAAQSAANPAGGLLANLVTPDYLTQYELEARPGLPAGTLVLSNDDVHRISILFGAANADSLPQTGISTGWSPTPALTLLLEDAGLGNLVASNYQQIQYREALGNAPFLARADYYYSEWLDTKLYSEVLINADLDFSSASLILLWALTDTGSNPPDLNSVIAYDRVPIMPEGVDTTFRFKPRAQWLNVIIANDPMPPGGGDLYSYSAEFRVYPSQVELVDGQRAPVTVNLVESSAGYISNPNSLYVMLTDVSGTGLGSTGAPGGVALFNNLTDSSGNSLATVRNPRVINRATGSRLLTVAVADDSGFPVASIRDQLPAGVTVSHNALYITPTDVCGHAQASAIAFTATVAGQVALYYTLADASGAAIADSNFYNDSSNALYVFLGDDADNPISPTNPLPIYQGQSFLTAIPTGGQDALSDNVTILVDISNINFTQVNLTSLGLLNEAPTVVWAKLYDAYPELMTLGGNWLNGWTWVTDTLEYNFAVPALGGRDMFWQQSVFFNHGIAARVAPDYNYNTLQAADPSQTYMDLVYVSVSGGYATGPRPAPAIPSTSSSLDVTAVFAYASGGAVSISGWIAGGYMGPNNPAYNVYPTINYGLQYALSNITIGTGANTGGLVADQSAAWTTYYDVCLTPIGTVVATNYAQFYPAIPNSQNMLVLPFTNLAQVQAEILKTHLYLGPSVSIDLWYNNLGYGNYIDSSLTVGGYSSLGGQSLLFSAQRVTTPTSQCLYLIRALDNSSTDTSLIQQVDYYSSAAATTGPTVYNAESGNLFRQPGSDNGLTYWFRSLPTPPLTSYSADSFYLLDYSVAAVTEISLNTVAPFSTGYYGMMIDPSAYFGDVSGGASRLTLTSSGVLQLSQPTERLYLFSLGNIWGNLHYYVDSTPSVSGFICTIHNAIDLSSQASVTSISLNFLDVNQNLLSTVTVSAAGSGTLSNVRTTLLPSVIGTTSACFFSVSCELQNSVQVGYVPGSLTRNRIDRITDVSSNVIIISFT